MSDLLEQLAGTTIPQAFQITAGRHSDDPALLAWHNERWEGRSYAECAQGVLDIACGLAHLGVQPDDRVGILGPNSPDWGLTYLGVLAAGAIAVPLDRLQTPSEWAQTLQRAGASAVVAALPERRHLEAELPRVPSVKQVISLGDQSDPPYLSLTQVRSSAARHPDWQPPLRRPEDLAVILFTSGTTGQSKGVMLSHHNILADAVAMLKVVDIRAQEDRFLSVLPLSHCYECTCGFIAPILAGARIYYARGMTAPEVVDGLRTSGATYLLGVPLLYEKLVAGITRGLRKKGGVAGRLGLALWGVARSGRPIWQHRFGKVVLKSIRREAGMGQIRYLISGGAPLPPEIGNSMQALGVKFLQGYGLSETSPVATLNPVDGAIPASVGVPLPGVEINIHDPDAEGTGEIWIKGPIVSRGYWEDPSATAAAFEEGWLKTGDLGCIERNGHLFITGRSKNLIVTPGGKNISPEEVELAARHSPFIAEIIVYGSRAKDGTGDDVHARIHPAYDYFKEWSEASGSATDLHTLLRKELDRTCAHLASYKRVKKFTVSETPFIKTSSHKIKRHLHTEAENGDPEDRSAVQN